jgi:hypothetical protein
MKMFPGSYLLIVVAKIFVIAVVAISFFVIIIRHWEEGPYEKLPRAESSPERVPT